ncbi:MAG: flagellar basal body-associated FliL family protein [Anaerolineae bacterium]|nr:flagellar basal body-associated FliL family protein [Anaerolineae bacterium]
MSDQVSNETRRSFNIVGLLKTIAIVLAVIVFLATAITNLLMVYIIFAPDDAPKPFYLMYYLPGQSPQVPIAAIPTAEPAAENNQNAQNAHSGENTSEVSTTPGAEASAPIGDVMPGSGILIDSGSKIVNLADPGGRTFIRTSIVLEFAPNSTEYFDTSEMASAGGEGSTAAAGTVKDAYVSNFKEELNTRLPVINDIIITVLSTKTYNQIYTSEGKEALRQEIMQAINSRLHEYKVIQVYFTDFVVQ